MNLTGVVLDDTYEIESIIGRGGFAMVYLARQLGLERKVAVKVLHSQHLADENAQLRFRREAKILASLTHPNIVKCFSFGIWQGQLPYIVFEYLEGESLRELLKREARLSLSEVLSIAEKVSAALAHAHARGVVHRDLKPENIFLLKNGELRVLDFGLAKFFEPAADEKTLTESGFLLGTAHYMSPEQCRGKDPDASSDLYSLACIIYELLSGKVPFEADTAIGVIYKHLNETPERLSKNLSEIPETVDLILFKALQKSQKERYASAEEMSRDFKLIQSGKTSLGLAIPGLSVSDAIKAEFKKEDKRPAPHFLSLLLLLAFLLSLIFVFSDPGPVGLLEAYSSFLPEENRYLFLKDCGEKFLAGSRNQAALLLFEDALKIRKSKPEQKIRILNDLAICNLHIGRNLTARDYSEKALELVSRDEFLQGCRDPQIIIETLKTAQKMNFLWREELYDALRHIADSKIAAGNSELHANVLAAIFSVCPGDNVVADEYVIHLLKFLELSELRHESRFLPPLLDSWAAHPSDYLSCRLPLGRIFAELKKRIVSRGKDSSIKDLVELVLNGIYSSNDSDAADLSCIFAISLQSLLESIPDSEINTQELQFSPEILEKRIYTAKTAVSRCFLLILAAQLYEIKRQYERMPSLVRRSLLQAGKIEGGEIQSWRKRQAYESLCRILEQLPDSFPEKAKLAIELYDELKASYLYRIGEYHLACLLKALSAANDIQPYKQALTEVIEAAKERSAVSNALNGALIEAADLRLERKDYEGVKFFVAELKKVENVLDSNCKLNYSKFLKNYQNLSVLKLQGS
ncbi:MAG: serine/threonine protein kinase [Candidatus Obscuribacterales bacterium]|nr:serine/threonine protein kinase [Candidatus Obscuribacterales bacterium]